MVLLVSPAAKETKELVVSLALPVHLVLMDCLELKEMLAFLVDLVHKA
jgi:hypothetical protein